jgi:hypothetical protein
VWYGGRYVAEAAQRDTERGARVRDPRRRGEGVMARPGIRELVGRLMTDAEFLRRLVREPEPVLADFELSEDERALLLGAAARASRTPERERARAFEAIAMKRWAT